MPRCSGIVKQLTNSYLCVSVKQTVSECNIRRKVVANLAATFPIGMSTGRCRIIDCWVFEEHQRTLGISNSDICCCTALSNGGSCYKLEL